MHPFAAVLSHELTLSLALAALVLAARHFAGKQIRGSSVILSEEQRRSLSSLRNGAIAAMLLGLIWIWSSQLQGFALSLAAFAVAIVIAFKEVILCVSGSIVVRTSQHPFKVGDWIEVLGHKGEVVDHNLLSTTVEEIISARDLRYTGRTIVIPNSVFHVHPPVHDNFAKRYSFHTLKFPIVTGADWSKAAEAAQAALELVVAEFLDDARAFVKARELKSGIDLPDPEPTVRYGPLSDTQYGLIITVYCPPNQVSNIEDAVSKAMLTIAQ